MGVFIFKTPMDKSIYSKEYSIFLELLRAAREAKGLSQSELAERLGETQPFVSKCETGERRLDIVETRAWCGALGVTLKELVGSFDKLCVERIKESEKS